MKKKKKRYKSNLKQHMVKHFQGQSDKLSEQEKQGGWGLK